MPQKPAKITTMWYYSGSWIQKRITWRIPEETSNPELHQLLNKYQYHKWEKGERHVHHLLQIWVSQTEKLSHRKMYNLPSSPEKMRINNYNLLLLMLWKANMDLQYIGESLLAIAQYVMGYMGKAERSNMQDLWQEVSSHSSVYSKL